MIKLALLLTLILTPVLGSTKGNGNIKGEGHFYAHNDDSLSFVKKQLIYSAFKDVITKELHNLGLDPIMFWQSYDKRFDDYFSGSWEALKQKYTDKKTDKIRDMKKYHKVLRHKKLKLKSRFGRLDRALISYSIKQMSRSVKNSNSRYLRISAKVDRGILSKMYRKFLVKGTVKKFTTIYVSSKFSLMETSWSELGVELSTDLTSVVNRHWKKWLEDNYAGIVPNIIIVSDELERELENRYRTPSGTAIVLDSKVPADNLGVAAGEILSESSGGNLWIKVNIVVKKLSDNKIIKKREFEIGGDLIVLDMQERRSVDYVDFKREKVTYSTVNDHQLSSDLASFIYRRPLEMLGTFKDKIRTLDSSSSTVQLEISNIESVRDLIDLNNFISTKGIILQLKLNIKSYRGSLGKVEARYSGSRDKLIELFSSLANQVVKDDLVIGVDPVNPFSLKLNKTDEVGHEEHKTNGNSNGVKNGSV